jgi:hypothetical protein
MTISDVTRNSMLTATLPARCRPGRLSHGDP